MHYYIQYCLFVLAYARFFISKDLKKAHKTSSAFDWLVEFSKKVVFGAFIVFLVSTVVEIIVIYKSSLIGEPISLDTFITETNNTFRIVVGTYCIKACMENLSKISFSKYADIVNIKSKLLKSKLTESTGVQFEETNTDVIIDPNEEPVYDNGSEEECMNDEIMS